MLYTEETMIPENECPPEITPSTIGFRARFAGKSKKIDLFSDALTTFFGSGLFLLFNVFLFIIWIVLNTSLVPGVQTFDPFPFTLLTMIVSLEAIFLSIIVLMSQNRASEVADAREEIDFEINLRAEKEITRILIMLDEIHDHLGLSPEDDAELTEMKLDIGVDTLNKRLRQQKRG